MSSKGFVILSAPSMNKTGDEISMALEAMGVKVPHYPVEYTTFANGEILAKIPETVRGLHVFLLVSLQYPDPNIEFMRMLITLNAIKYAHADCATVVVPFCSYFRQDRKDQPRVPITARLVADLIEANKVVKSVITADMHAEQIQGFFSIPVDNLSGSKVFARYISESEWFKNNLKDIVVLSPDFGSAKRNRKLALALGKNKKSLPVTIAEKNRTGPNKAEVVSFIGASVKGKIVVSFEDMICTGTTAIKVGKAIMAKGAKAFYLCATHGIFSKNAEERFRESGIKVVTTDTIPREDSYYAENSSWLTCVSMVPYLSEAIFEAMKVGGSISKLDF